MDLFPSEELYILTHYPGFDFPAASFPVSGVGMQQLALLDSTPPSNPVLWVFTGQSALFDVFLDALQPCFLISVAWQLQIHDGLYAAASLCKVSKQPEMARPHY